MATLLQITNAVLKRLREDPVGTLDEDYPNLIASFVADIAAEVNDSGPGWSALDHEVTVAVSAGTRVYDISADTTDRSTLLFDVNGHPQAWLFDDDTDPQGHPMWYIDPTTYEARYQLDRDQTNSEPVHFTLIANTDKSGWSFAIWPEPTQARYVRIRFNTPEAELDPDSDAATNILVNNRVVRLGALYMALNERGEEIGEPGGIAEQRYQKALADAIEDEIRTRERAGYYDWSRN